MSFVFYDTETTGTHTAFDQILQFAAIRTDAELNELERFEIRCQLLPHIVPSPVAMRITGVRAARLIDPTLPTHYAMMRQIRDKMLSWSPAVFVGYNSLHFDEHLLRQALYKTLHPPYLTNSSGNSRTDILKAVQAASLFAPAALTVPIGEEGCPVFKLDRVAPANGFNHANAHDALADVEATIFLARLLMDRAPDIWSAFMRFGQKAAVSDYITNEPVFCFAEFYFGAPYAWLVTHLGQNSENTSEFYVYDLSVPPESLIDLSDDDLAARLACPPKPIRRLKGNAAPVLMPQDEAPPIAAATALPLEERERRIQFLVSTEGLRERLIRAFETTRAARQLSPHVEEQLYDGFFAPTDVALCEEFHATPWSEKPAIVEWLEDRRLRGLGRRLIYTEQPQLLSESTCRSYAVAIARRLTDTGAVTPWLSLPQAIRETNELLTVCEAHEQAILREHLEYLSRRLVWANGLLG